MWTLIYELIGDVKTSYFSNKGELVTYVGKMSSKYGTDFSVLKVEKE